MNKILILVRHAHRDKAHGRETDNGLSARGEKQAEAIRKHFRKVYPGAKPVIMSSPKKRCIETVLPLAGGKLEQIKISDLLNEGGKLDKKVIKFIQWWKTKAPALSVACSHGDWLPICIEKLTGAHVELSKGAWCEIHKDDANPATLAWLIQEL